MKQDYTHISFVLDRSGSMQSIKSDTIGGFNKFLEDQKKEKGECSFLLAQFDDEYEVVHHFKSIEDIPELNNETFVPRNLTRLLDAIGKSINDTGKELEKMSESDHPGKVLFVILTDGQENDSREFNHKQINDMIKHQSDIYNWQFIFLGANQDAIATAGDIGIKSGNAMTWASNKLGTQSAYSTLSASISNYRNADIEDMNEMDAFSDEDRQKQEEAMQQGN